ncbi:MAG: hypothetical protein K0Q43_977, partial [Ramlibacter sp.]|nr:hypothetical protein [Ramlibacter sp.]
MTTKILSKAATGERVQTSNALDGAASAAIAVKAADCLNLHSPQALLVARKRIGRDLSLEFDDGQSVVLKGFYTPQGAEAAPTLVVSTGDISEIFVGAADGASDVAQGLVNGKLVTTPVNGEYAESGDGELFSGSAPYISAQSPNVQGDVMADASDADAQPLAAGNGASAEDGDDDYWGIIAAFVPLFFAAADMAREFGASGMADDGAKSPTVWIDAISTDTGESNADFITSDTTLTLNGHASELANGQRLQVSSDGGITWVDVTVLANGQWSYEDPNPHGDSFTYQARIINSESSVLSTASQAVTVDTHASGEPGASDGVAVSITAVHDDVAPLTGTVANGGTTDDSSPAVSGTLTGTLAADEVIAIYRDNTRVGTATLSGNSWSFTDAGLSTGAHAYQARVEDLAGNQGAISGIYAITVAALGSGGGGSSNVFSVSITAVNDDVAPLVGTVASGGATNDTSPTLSGSFTGTLGSGEVIAIYRDDSRVGTATLSGSSWGFVDSGLADGSYSYQARVEDLAGNQAATSSAYAITVDTHASGAPGANDGVSVSITAVNDDVAAITGMVASGGFTNDTSPSLSGGLTGTLAAGEVIAIYRDNIRVGTASLSGNGWSFTDSGVADGAHSYQARVEDLAGNQGATSTAYAITVDTHASGAPGSNDGVSLSITAINDDVAPLTGTLANGGTTDDTSPTLSGSLTGALAAGEVIAIYRDNVRLGAAILTGNSWSFTDGGLADGAHTYVARIEDLAGNQGAASSVYSITVDTSGTGKALVITTITDDTGTSDTDFITRDTVLEVRGTNATLLPDSRIEV